MDEHEKNDLIMRQRQEIERLTNELARAMKVVDRVVEHRKKKNSKE